MGSKDDPPGHLAAFLVEFGAESDRAAVILGAAKLDILLYQVLQRFLLPTPTSEDRLLEGESALGTFSARINAAYRMGLIDAALARALHLVRKIRNAFAHETAAGDLSTGPYQDRVRELVAPLRSDEGFESGRDLPGIKHTRGASRNFRVALAIICTRLDFLLGYVKPLSRDRAMPLVIPKKPATAKGSD